MSKGNFTGTSASAQLLAADIHRSYIFIQKTNATTIALGIGEAAEAGKGIQLTNINDTVILRGSDARKAIYVIGNSGAGTYQTGDGGDLTYTPGPYVTV